MMIGLYYYKIVNNLYNYYQLVTIYKNNKI